MILPWWTKRLASWSIVRKTSSLFPDLLFIRTKIEEVIAHHGQVMEVACIGVPDETGEAPKSIRRQKDTSLTKARTYRLLPHRESTLRHKHRKYRIPRRAAQLQRRQNSPSRAAPKYWGNKERCRSQNSRPSPFRRHPTVCQQRAPFTLKSRIPTRVISSWPNSFSSPIRRCLLTGQRYRRRFYCRHPRIAGRLSNVTMLKPRSYINVDPARWARSNTGEVCAKTNRRRGKPTPTWHHPRTALSMTIDEPAATAKQNATERKHQRKERWRSTLRQHIAIPQYRRNQRRDPLKHARRTHESRTVGDIEFCHLPP